MAERLRLLEVGRWETEERRVINAVRVLELQVIVDQGKQLVRYFSVADFVLNNGLKVFKFDISFGHWIQLSQDLIFNGSFIITVEHIVQFLHGLVIIVFQEIEFESKSISTDLAFLYVMQGVIRL